MLILFHNALFHFYMKLPSKAKPFILKTHEFQVSRLHINQLLSCWHKPDMASSCSNRLHNISKRQDQCGHKQTVFLHCKNMISNVFSIVRSIQKHWGVYFYAAGLLRAIYANHELASTVVTGYKLLLLLRHTYVSTAIPHPAQHAKPES